MEIKNQMVKLYHYSAKNMSMIYSRRMDCLVCETYHLNKDWQHMAQTKRHKYDDLPYLETIQQIRHMVIYDRWWQIMEILSL
jgi:hypothetical protein